MRFSVHEFSIAQGLLEVVLERAKLAGAERIDRISMEIGVLAGIEDEALLFAFNVLAEDTPAARAQLVIDKVPLRCYCATCDAVFECKPFAYRCPVCDEPSAQVRTGKEMNLLSIEVP